MNLNQNYSKQATVYSRQTGYIAVPDGANGVASLMELTGVVSPVEGYIFVYLTNESNEEVYFDDLEVKLKESNVVQSNNYYPFGLQHATSWTRISSVKNNFLYNAGMELNQRTKNYETYFREYDPALGRFNQIDPMASKYSSFSPYNYAFNDPISFNDPYGDDPFGDSWSSWEDIFDWISIILDKDGTGGGYWGADGTQYDFSGEDMVNVVNGALAGYNNYHTGSSGFEQQTVFYTLNSGSYGGFNTGAKSEWVPIEDYGNTVHNDNGNQNGGMQDKPLIIDSNMDALKHYFNGNGETAELGPNTTRFLIESSKFKSIHERITSGKARSLNGNFSVDLTKKMFHVGRTGVKYSIHIVDNTAYVNYVLYHNDGFWDPDFIDEKIAGIKPDGMGPNLERFGGTPYHYAPQSIWYTIVNPGY